MRGIWFEPKSGYAKPFKTHFMYENAVLACLEQLSTLALLSLLLSRWLLEALCFSASHSGIARADALSRGDLAPHRLEPLIFARLRALPHVSVTLQPARRMATEMLGRSGMLTL